MLERVGDQRYVVLAPTAAAVADLDFVAEVRPYRPGDTADPNNLVLPGGPIPGARPVRYEVLAHRPADLPGIREWLARRGWPEDGVGRRKVRFRCAFGDPGLLELVDRQDVAAVDLYVPPTLLNDHTEHVVDLRLTPPARLGCRATRGVGSYERIGMVARRPLLFLEASLATAASASSHESSCLT
ncbi:hypothetical protein [Saccharothrix variisporea]|uniref:hypothetical protein n=1 Tax=Saccharothrix variisporea TaxID=543527 RepID=UPI0011C353BE|nr:hypothetical protein [Saccharothrix variisporea]